MPYPKSSTWKTHTQSDSAGLATISCYFNPCGHRKISHLSLFSTSDPSSPSCSSSLASHMVTFRQTLTKNSLKNATSHEAKAKVVVSKEIFPIRSKSVPKRKPFWRKILLGSKKFRSILLLHVITIVYASNIPVVKEVEAFTDPAAFSAIRFAVSAVPFIPFVFWARNDVQTRNEGMELGLWVSLGYLIEALGLITSEAGRASFISLFTVIVVPLLESMLGAIVPARTWFGVLMSVLGVAMLECSGSPPCVGDLLNFLSAIFFGIHTLRTEHISRRTKRKNFLPLLGYEVCVVALLSTIWYLIGGYFDGVKDSNAASWTWVVLWEWMVVFPWIPALYTGVFSTGLCLWAEIIALRNVSATETTIIYGLEPLWGAGFAWFLLGERWGIDGWIGAALLLGGSLTVQILGDSPFRTRETEEDDEDDLLIVSNKQKSRTSLSTSPVPVRSRKDIYCK